MTILDADPRTPSPAVRRCSPPSPDAPRRRNPPARVATTLAAGQPPPSPVRPSRPQRHAPAEPYVATGSAVLTAARRIGRTRRNRQRRRHGAPGRSASPARPGTAAALAGEPGPLEPAVRRRRIDVESTEARATPVLLDAGLVHPPPERAGAGRRSSVAAVLGVLAGVAGVLVDRPRPPTRAVPGGSLSAGAASSTSVGRAGRSAGAPGHERARAAPTVVASAVGMVAVPAGAYPVGSATPGAEAAAARAVTLAAFHVDTLEVANADYNRFVQSQGAPAARSWPLGRMPEDKANHPVTGVEWGWAQAYCVSLGKRLPRDAEWEAAARGPAGLDVPLGRADRRRRPRHARIPAGRVDRQQRERVRCPRHGRQRLGVGGRTLRAGARRAGRPPRWRDTAGCGAGRPCARS